LTAITDGSPNDLLLLVARLLLMATFVVSLIDKVRAPPAELQQIHSLGLPTPIVFERLAGIFEFVCIAMIAMGMGARWAAAALCALTLFLTFAFLRYWNMPPSQPAVLTRTLFFNNVSVCAGLLFVTAAGPGTHILHL